MNAAKLCKCAAEKDADAITTDELSYVAANKEAPPTLKAREKEISQACFAAEVTHERSTAMGTADHPIQFDEHPLMQPGPARDESTKSFVENCKATAPTGSINVDRYCQCVAEKTADAITGEEMLYNSVNGHMPPSAHKRVVEISQACGADAKANRSWWPF